MATLGPACQETTTEPTPPLAIQCTAVPAVGPAPLDVGFGLQIQNAVGTVAVAVSYGDGTQGTNPDARHVYSVAGEYAASITVTAGAHTARCSAPVSVTPAPAPQPTPRGANQPPDAVFRTTPPTASAVLTRHRAFPGRATTCARPSIPRATSSCSAWTWTATADLEYRGSSGSGLSPRSDLRRRHSHRHPLRDRRGLPLLAALRGLHPAPPVPVPQLHRHRRPVARRAASALAALGLLLLGGVVATRPARGQAPAELAQLVLVEPNGPVEHVARVACRPAS